MSGRELQFICAEFVFEYTGQFQSKNEHKFNKSTFTDNSYRRLFLIKEWDERKCAWDCAYYRFCSNLFRPWDSIWGRLFNYTTYFCDFVGNRLHSINNFPRSGPPTNVRLIGPIILELHCINDNRVKILISKK